jgi:glycosyltransferase involved in cell wall biosynthesis
MDAAYRSVSVVIPVFRDGLRAVAAARQVRTQHLAPHVVLEIVLVDDGSDDDTPGQLASLSASEASVLRLATNQGRSAARNAGAKSATGEMLVFMDSDCQPMGADFLSAHLAALSSGAIASTGVVTGDGAGFWERYQREASWRRERQHQVGMQYAGSSQNLAVRKAAFDQVGGFDEGYRQYGFEDRDLLVRLAVLGRIAWTRDAVVRHLDALSLVQVSRKMAEAGEHSSPRFAALHPDAYRALGYARLDARRRPWLRLLARPLDAILVPLSRLLDGLLAEPALPYALKAMLVQLVTGASYLAGTSRTPR